MWKSLRILHFFPKKFVAIANNNVEYSSVPDLLYTAQKIETADLATFTEEILNGKLQFLYSVTKVYIMHVKVVLDNTSEWKIDET